MDIQLRVENVSKTFVLHNQKGTQLPVFHGISLTVAGGQCIALNGHSGSGKSTLLRSLYGNYQPDGGRILVRHRGEWIDMVSADARDVLQVRRYTVGWVSQFLRVIPRISTLEVVIQPLLEQGAARRESEQKAGELLTRLNVPERLGRWHRLRFQGASSSASILPAASSVISPFYYWTSQRHRWMSPIAMRWCNSSRRLRPVVVR